MGPFGYISIVMKIKIVKETGRKQSNLYEEGLYPEFKKSIQPHKGIVFQSQSKSIQNYFSLLQRLFGRDVKAKEILKTMAKQERENKFPLHLQITQTKDEEQNIAFNNSVLRSTISQTHHTPPRPINRNQRYDPHKPKWKESILRRKNNGSHGQIMKGNPKNNHSRLMSRITWTEESVQEPQRQIQDFLKQEFIPVGKQYISNSVNQTTLSSSKRADVKSSLSSKPKARISSLNKPLLVSRRGKQSEKMGVGKQMLSRTCFPLSNMQMSGSITIRRQSVLTPYRYKSRLSTPCPWDYTTHR